VSEGIEIDIYSYTDWTTRVDTLNGRMEPKFLNELKGVGSGSFKIAISDPKIVANPDLLKARNIAKVKVNGRVVGAFKIQNKEASTIGEGEKAQEAYLVTGPGLKQLLADAQVRPFGGLRSDSKDNRGFNFSSPIGDWYVPAQWTKPDYMDQVGNTPGSPWRYAPTKWPGSAMYAKWMWDTSTVRSSGKEDYFRLAFNADEEGTYRLYLAAQDSWAVYLDGEQIKVSDPDTTAWTEATKIEMDLTEGDHVLGIYATNSKSSRAAVVYALYQAIEGADPVDRGVVGVPIQRNVKIRKTNHGFKNGQKVFFTTTGTMPGGMSANKNYYVTNATFDSFQIRNTPGGGKIDTTGSSTGDIRAFKPGKPDNSRILTYSGVSTAYLGGLLTTATNQYNAAKDLMDSLPPGDADPDDKLKPAVRKQLKAQHKKYAAARSSARNAHAKVNSISAAKDKAADIIAAGYEIKVRGNPSKAPGYSIGELILTLLAEADDRGVNIASLLTPTFTKSVDSNGVAWPEPIDWVFKVGDSLLTVIQAIEELDVADVYINPNTYQLNIVQQRGVDRTQFTTDVDGVTIKSTPVTFEKANNVRKAVIQSSGKLVNAIAMKTNKGWSPWVAVGDSVDEYGMIEDVLDTGTTLSASRQLANQVFKLKQREEEGATYDFYVAPNDKTPFLHYDIGDLVLAPSSRNQRASRRVMSIALEEVGTLPVYSIEVDTIFQTNEARLATAIKKTGGAAGVGGGSTVGGGSSIGSGVGIVTPDPDAIQTIPLAPVDLEVMSIGDWSMDGVTAISTVTISWEPVDTNTDGSESLPAYYEVWGHLTGEDDNTYQLFASVANTNATIGPFSPGDEWSFKVYAFNDPSRRSDDSVAVDVIMEGPDVPLAPPSDPVLTSKMGLTIAHWDGLIAGVAPLSQFRYVFAEWASTSAGPWTRAGNALQGEGNIMIPGLTIDSTVFVHLIAVDGVGISSEPSGSPSITVEGVDFGTLKEDLEKAQADVEEAKGDIADLEDDLAGVDDAIAGISTDVDVALTSASGKNQIIYSINNPSGTGSAGDTWFKRNAVDSSILDGQWEWTGSGTQHNDFSHYRDAFGIVRTNYATNPNGLGISGWDTYYNPVVNYNDPSGAVPPNGGRWIVYTLTPRASAQDNYPQGIINMPTIPTVPGNGYVRATMWVQGTQGDLVTVAGRTSSGEGYSQHVVTMTGQPQRVGVIYQPRQDTQGVTQIGIQAVIQRPDGFTGTTIKASNAQIEYFTTQPADEFGIYSDGDMPGAWWGTAGWVAKAIGNDLIAANIDAGKLTAGFVSADRLRAHSILVDKLAVSSFQNIATIDEVTGLNLASSQGPTYGSDTKIVDGWIDRIDDTAAYFMFTYQHGPLPFEPGDELLFKFNAVADDGTSTSVVPTVWVYDDFGGNIASETPGIVLDTQEATYTAVVPINPNYDRALYKTFILGLQGVGGKNVRVRKVTVTRRNGGELIVDGSITADKMGLRELTAVHIQVGSLVGELFEFNTILGQYIGANTIEAFNMKAGTLTANEIATGSLTADLVSPTFGGDLDITANDTVQIIVGQVQGVQDAADAVSDGLDAMQTYYTFGPDGAVISTPASPFAVAIDNDSIDMLENGNVVSYWNSGTLFVDQMVGQKVILGNHQLEKYGTGTVVRSI
jgi:hypothetical protein